MPDPASRPVVYLAGPYSHPDPVRNTHRAVEVANDVLEFCYPVVPHLSMLWHAITPKPYPDWLEIDLAVMYRCHAVYRFDEDHASSGADAEVEEALARDMDVFFDRRALRHFCARWAPDAAPAPA